MGRTWRLLAVSIIVCTLGWTACQGEPSADDDDDDDDSADPCAAYVGLATPEEISATPRDDADIEAVALCLTGGFIAQQDVYDRVDADVAAIRTGDEAVADMELYHHVSGNRMSYHTDDDTFALMVAGEYHEWDCLHERYVLDHINFSEVLSAGDIYVKGYYNMELLCAEYESLPGIAGADPSHDLSDGPRIRGVIEGDTIHYVFDNRWGDCLDGCMFGEARYYVSEAPGEFTFVDGIEWNRKEKIDWPDWYGAYNHCEYQY